VQTEAQFLPDDGYQGSLLGRIWNPSGACAGPSVVAVRAAGVFDVSARFPTVADLLDQADPASALAGTPGVLLGSVAQILANTPAHQRTNDAPYFLAPIDVQVIKAAGVTFADSLLERVIEEHTKGDASKAQASRALVQAVMGDGVHSVKPGSAQAAALKQVLQEKGWWSQYLEVGIGPDVEVFTKAPVLAAVGTGQAVGIRSDSVWNNPEPEVVLVVNAHGRAVGATLGNDVNLRDIEGRSALLLGKAKDNNASCAIGPLVRLFDVTFDLDDVRQMQVDLTVRGTDGFEMCGVNQMARISRDPLEILAQTTACHQYPDGFVLFMGTLFAPTQDRGEAGSGFTHQRGDVVRIRSSALGELCNVVEHSEAAPPWRFGVRALMRNLGQRGLLRTDNEQA
jgi:fumarylacetoacetate (FAA) hydrolase family protein